MVNSSLKTKMGRPRAYDDQLDDVLRLHKLDWSVREIAVELHIPKSTVARMIGYGAQGQTAET